jgi:hypothetical protein
MTQIISLAQPPTQPTKAECKPQAQPLIFTPHNPLKLDSYLMYLHLPWKRSAATIREYTTYKAAIHQLNQNESGSKFLRSIFLRLKIPKLKVPKLKGPTTQSSYCSMFLRLKVPTVAKFLQIKVPTLNVPMGAKFLQRQSSYWFKVPTVAKVPKSQRSYS